MTDHLENMEQEAIVPVTEENPAMEPEEGEGVVDEAEEKTKRKTRRKKSEPEEPEFMEESEQSDSESNEGDFPEGSFLEEAPLPPDAEQEVLTGPESKQTRRPAALDSFGNVIRDRSNSTLRDISVLTAARNARRILTATIDAIETGEDTTLRAVFYVGTVKVMIPFPQMGFDLDPKAATQREARMLMGSMLGAKIDYMVRGIDAEARIAAASRRDAMIVRQASILNARGTSREYRINEGMRVMARIVHVSRFTVRVEVYGFESFVPINRISNLWVSDIREVIQVGEERLVEITSLTRNKEGKVTAMEVSIKAAEDAPQLQLREGDTYTGHIINFSEKAYYVRISGMPAEIRCPIKSSHTMELIDIGDLVKFYIRGVHDGVPTGAILKVLKKRMAPEY